LSGNVNHPPQMIPNPIKLLSKPEYFYRPSQVFRRLLRTGRSVPMNATVRLPWGAAVRVHTRENIGCDIYHYGIFDKIVPEAIGRLLDSGETGVDVGANIGQNSLLMAAKVGPSGRVFAFEPHPEIFLELKTNHDSSRNPHAAAAVLENVALGNMTGECNLEEGEQFSHNRGSASLNTQLSEGKGINVKVRQLDEFLDKVNLVGVCKIDVEGHELDVLQGAEKTLKRRGIRDLIFEDFKSKPSPVTVFLERHGYSLFALNETWLKPRLAPFAAHRHPPGLAFSSNYLATLDRDRAAARFRALGWHCLLSL
jgi:FkbM family methyltransferase